MVVIPLVKRTLPEARLPFQDVSVLTVAATASGRSKKDAEQQAAQRALQAFA